jgi:hypothetical protein
VDDFIPLELETGTKLVATNKPIRARVFNAKYGTTRQGRPKVWLTDGGVYPGPAGKPTAFIWSHPRGDIGNASYQGFVPWDWVKLIDPPSTVPTASGQGVDLARGSVLDEAGDDGTNSACPICKKPDCKKHLRHNR